MANGLYALWKTLQRPSGEPVGDAELLRRYREADDHAAFELLVHRHGPMVLASCRRTLGDEQLAEDAFQAVFWILAIKAVGIRNADMLGPWLHRIARRVAWRAVQHRRKHAEVPLTELPTLARPESSFDLDDAIDRLSERHRRVIVLCYLEGRTTEDAATLLNIPRGTVLSRLAAARKRLAEHLDRRGLALPAVVPLVLLTADQVKSALPLSVAATGIAAHSGQGVLTMMLRQKIAAVAAVLFTGSATFTMLGVGLTPGTQPVAAQAQEKPKAEVPKSEVPKAEDTKQLKIAKLSGNLEKLATQMFTKALELQEMNRELLHPAEAKALGNLLSNLEVQIFDLQSASEKIEVEQDALRDDAKAKKMAPIADERLYPMFSHGKLAQSATNNKFSQIWSKHQRAVSNLRNINSNPRPVVPGGDDFDKLSKTLEEATKALDEIVAAERPTLEANYREAIDAGLKISLDAKQLELKSVFRKLQFHETKRKDILKKLTLHDQNTTSIHRRHVEQELDDLNDLRRELRRSIRRLEFDLDDVKK